MTDIYLTISLSTHNGMTQLRIMQRNFEAVCYVNTNEKS